MLKISVRGKYPSTAFCKELKSLAWKSFFIEEIYDLRQEISFGRSQLEQERLHRSRNNYCVEKEENNNQELKRQTTFMPDRKSAIKRRN